MTLQPARLKIWINKKPVLQGKFYYLNRKPVFLVNIDDNKLFRNYNGYAIAASILEAIKKSKLRGLRILFKHVTRGIVYVTNRSTFQSKGVPVKYGGHRQWVLPLKNWKFFKGELNEPFNLRALTTDQWLEDLKFERKPVVEDFSAPLSVLEKLRKLHPELEAKLRA